MEPNDQLPNTQPQKPEPTSRSHRSRKILYISIIVLLIFLILHTGLYFLSKSTNPAKKASNNSPLDNPLVQQMAEKLPIPKITMTLITLAPTPTFAINPPTPQSTPKPTETNNQNWTTYNNTTLNFSLLYPSHLTVKENEHGFGVADITFSNTTNHDYQMLFYPAIIGKLIVQDFNTLYALPANTTQRMTSETMKPQLYTKINNRTINGHRALDFEATDDPPDPYIEPEVGTYIELGENRMIISTRQSNRATLNQMLINFKSPIKN